MNNFQIIGNLTADPKEYAAKDGTVCAKFSVAVNGYGGKTDYVNVTAWGKLGENCLKYLVKGKKVFVSGTASCHAWQNQRGEVVGNIEINAGLIEFLTKSSEGEESDEEPKPRAKKAATKEPKGSRYQPSDDEDLPF